MEQISVTQSYYSYYEKKKKIKCQMILRNQNPYAPTYPLTKNT